jgi:hypothetical protein
MTFFIHEFSELWGVMSIFCKSMFCCVFFYASFFYRRIGALIYILHHVGRAQGDFVVIHLKKKCMGFIVRGLGQTCVMFLFVCVFCFLCC